MLLKRVRLECGYCGKTFLASQNQSNQSRWPSTRHINFMCSRECQHSSVSIPFSDMSPLQAQTIARSKLNRAVASGKISKPTKCARCNSNPGHNRYGRSQLHGHHHDYSKPLEVEWLCVYCHKKDTPQAIGSRCGASKLTDGKVKRLRKESADGRTGVALSKKYGISTTMVSDIINRKWWRHI